MAKLPVNFLPYYCIQNLEKNNGNDGYIFQLGEDLHNTPNAREVIEMAMCDWTIATGVNFILSPDYVENPEKNMNDDINTIFLANVSSVFSDPNSPPTAETFHKKNSVDLGASKVGYVTDIDIAIKNFDIDWHISLTEVVDDNDPNTNKLDFYSAMIHEIGHGHSLWHATSPTLDIIGDKLMYPFLNPEINRRVIDNTADNGGDFIISTNSVLNQISTLAQPMVPLSPTFCMTSTNEVEVLLTELSIFPNPTNGILNLEFKLEKPNEVKIAIVDILGRRLMEQNLGQRADGKHLEQLSIELPVGAYLLILEIGEGQVFNKFLKQN